MNEQINQIPEKYLPVGTVVLLKEAEKRVTIIGFCIIPKEDQNKMYDYLGCMYPEGVLDPKEGLMFNHDQIDKIFHLGLIDKEEQNFKSNLKRTIEETFNSEKQSNQIESIQHKENDISEILKLEE